MKLDETGVQKYAGSYVGFIAAEIVAVQVHEVQIMWDCTMKRIIRFGLYTNIILGIILLFVFLGLLVDIKYKVDDSIKDFNDCSDLCYQIAIKFGISIGLVIILNISFMFLLLTYLRRNIK